MNPAPSRESSTQSTRFARLARLLTHPRFSENTQLIVLSIVVGISTGLAGVGFGWLIEFFQGLFYGNLAELTPPELHDARYPTILAIGGLLVGPLVYYFAREAKGHGVPEVMAAVALRGGAIRKRVALVKALASAICLGSGGSAGREGPIVQIGSAMGSSLGQATRMSRNRLKVMVGCGAAGGIAAVFNAPIAGVMFAVEIILGDFAAATLTPVILASVLASVTSHALLGDKAVFTIPNYTIGDPFEIPLFLGLGVLTGVSSVLFTRFLYWTEDLFDLKLPLHPVLRPALGGLLLGGLAIYHHHVLGDGYHVIDLALKDALPVKLMLILFGLKIAATCLTLGSGNSGGIFAPALFMGAMIGGAFGHSAHGTWPHIVVSPGAYALAGMAGLVAGTTHAPITAILILFEMSGDYRMMLPLMMVSAVSVLVASRIFRDSIYTLKLARRGINIRQGREINVMGSIHVADVMKRDPEVVPSHMQLNEVIQFAQDAQASSFPVVDRNRRLTGMLSVQDIRDVMDENLGAETAAFLIAQDIATVPPLYITPEQNLNDAMNRFGQRDVRFLPVVEAGDSMRLLGVIDRGSVIGAYNRALLRTEE